MFIPTPFKMTDDAQAQQFIHNFGFGVLVSHSGRFTATHLPFVLNHNQGEKGVLYAHCGKANNHWKDLDKAQVMVIFNGPHGYVSPTWYSNKPAVPTWNYTAVHAYGTAELLNSQDTLMAVNSVVEQYEPQLLDQGDIVTEHLKQQMLSAIVGFKITLSELHGQLKLSQNKSQEDQSRIIKALSGSPNCDDVKLARYMQRNNLARDAQ